MRREFHLYFNGLRGPQLWMKVLYWPMAVGVLSRMYRDPWLRRQSPTGTVQAWIEEVAR
jgi:hypothetical protein